MGSDTFYKTDLSPFYLRGSPSPLLHIIYFIPWAGFLESARDSIFEQGCVLHRPHLSSHNLHFYTWIQYVYLVIHVIILLQPSLPYYNKGSLVVTPFSPNRLHILLLNWAICLYEAGLLGWDTDLETIEWNTTICSFVFCMRLTFVA